MQTLLQAVAEAAGEAGAAALRHFGMRLRVEIKDDGTPVTAADREAEEAARTWIEARFPEDGIVGEEPGESKRGARRCWLVDPVDGTKSFVRGVPLWGALVAVAEGGTVLAGAACFPALGETIAAARGCGCWWNGARAAVSGVSELAAATVLTTDERFSAAPARRAGWERLAAQAALSRSWGDAYGYLLVATGRAEVMTDGVLAAWDAAPFQPIVEEAGGVLTDWDGVPTVFAGGAIATNRRLAEIARHLLTGRPPEESC